MSLLLTVACFPLCVVLGAAALVRNYHPTRADRVCAWLAVLLGGAVPTLAPGLAPPVQDDALDTLHNGWPRT